MTKHQVERSVHRWVAAGMFTLLSPLFAPPLMAAPVTTTDGVDSLETARDPMQPGGRPLTAPITAARGLDKSLGQEASTGNKNLDLLLELQGKTGDEPRQVAPRSAAAATSASPAAASAAAAALAALRAKAAERPAQNVSKQNGATQNDAKQNDLRPRAAPQPLEGMGTLDGEARTAQPTERRQWSGQLGGGGGGGAGYGSGAGDSGSSRGGYDDDGNLLRKLQREVMAFLRDNGVWLTAALGGLAVIGAALKAYSRRI